jgi:elongation factor P--(R)-beta-lysine ligase
LSASPEDIGADLYCSRPSDRFASGMKEVGFRLARDAMPNSGTSPWWSREAHLRRRPALMMRARIIAALRGWFAGEGFIEVESAALQISPGNEAHLHAFSTHLTAMDGTAHALHLHTSPEFSCKKLLSAGETRIVDFARVFRNRERSALHHPEFTLLEWYRTGEPYTQLMDDCAALLALSARITGAGLFSYRGRVCNPFLEPERLTVARAFARHAGIDLMATLSNDGQSGDAAMLAQMAQAAGIRTAPDDTWADVFSRVISERIEPQLGIGHPVILYEYPTCEAALARPAAHDARVAERFELYVCGVELANAFGELTDPTEQRRRFQIEMDEKARIYGERYPLDEDFLTALGTMPQASGIALGLDRLVMLATGAERITDVIWTPVADPGNDEA